MFNSSNCLDFKDRAGTVYMSIGRLQDSFKDNNAISSTSEPYMNIQWYAE